MASTDAVHIDVQLTSRPVRLAAICAQLLNEIAPGWYADPHMVDTPTRWAKWWTEFIEPSEHVNTTFEASHVDQMVAVTGIDTWSLCAHHLLPFSASVSIGYLADERVLGLSKFARIAHAEASRPTSQEQLAADIASAVELATGSGDVAVTVTGQHLCMTMRGVKTPATMTTSVTRGAFRDEPETRAEWFALLTRAS